MTLPLAVKENQMRAIIRAARKESARLEVRLGDVVVTVYPDEPDAVKKPASDDEDFAL